MKTEYVELVKYFRNLSDEEKMEEILNNVNELLNLLYTTNASLNSSNESLPLLNDYSNESEFYAVLFTNVISIKEETAKLINISKNI